MDYTDSDSLLKAHEEFVCRMILDYAKEFYKDSVNRQAFERWIAPRKKSSEPLDNNTKFQEK